MPKWLKKEISDKKLSICDLGCGMGEGVNLFKSYFNDSEITGVDFSNYAIEKARKKYPNVSFDCVDITDFEKQYDVIVSSHTLEHFENPLKIFNKIINLAKKYFILIIPFQEKDLYHEHFYRFDYDFFPIHTQNHELIHFKEIDKLFFEPGGYWDKEQIMVVYVNKNNVDINQFSLNELKNNNFNHSKSIKKDYESLLDKSKNLESNLINVQENAQKLEKNYLALISSEQAKCEDLINKNKDLIIKKEKLECSLINEKKNVENYLALISSEQAKCEDLINKNKDLIIKKEKLECSLINEKKNVETEQAKCEDLINKNKDLIIKKEKLESNLLSQRKIHKRLKKENNTLKSLLNAQKSRKIVKLTDKLLITFRIFKSKLKGKTLNQKQNSSNTTKKKVSNTKEKKLGNTISTFTTMSKQEKINVKRIKDIKVAVVLDEFSYNCFKYEFNAIPIEPSNWLEIFETKKPDVFLCESAWSGIDSTLRPWKGQIYSSINFKYENRTVLLAILDYCKKHNIPTIFWNKEDPTHYHDKVCNFVDTAIKFDHIFTTSKECIQKYKEDYGHESVHLLMFAAQPKLFNPIDEQERSKDVIFAGSWYSQHSQRCKDMIQIFDKILDSGYNLKIYDRVYYTHKGDPTRVFPEKYSEYVNPPVSFNQMGNVYKESEYAININTETESSTMFARRVFELMLCNTLVLSNYSKGMQDLFGDDVIFLQGGDEKLDLSSTEESRLNNLYNVLKNHTYSVRFKQLLDNINYRYIDENKSISIYYVVNTKYEIETILRHYKSITYSHKNLVLLLSDQISNHLIKNVYKEYASSEISVYSLNYLLNTKAVTNTINKMENYHGNVINLNELLSNRTPYFVFANLQLRPDSIEKTLLHYQYIGKEFGITLGNEFVFKEVDDPVNVVFHNSNFEKVFNRIFRDIYFEFPIYTCKIEAETRLINLNQSKTQEKQFKSVNLTAEHS